MIITKEIALEDFEAWSGAEFTMETLRNLAYETDRDIFGELEIIMEECTDSWDETSINDFLWFENETIADWLGFADWEELERIADGNAIDESELNFSVGDEVYFLRIQNVGNDTVESPTVGEIISIDYTDADLPYYVKYLELVNDKRKENYCWCGENELEEI